MNIVHLNDLMNVRRDPYHRVITLRINSACETMLRICQVELRLSSCVCVYSQQKMCPVQLYHQVYFVGRNFLVQKYIFSCLPGTIRHSLVLQSK